MARINRIASARKEHKCSKCGNVIEVGKPYLKATPYKRPSIIRCVSCGLKTYETSGSEFVREAGRVSEDWEEEIGLDSGTVEQIISVLEDLKDQSESSLDNMPEQLHEGDTGMMLQERIEMLEEVIEELNSVSYEDIEADAKTEVETEMGDYDPEDDTFEDEEEFEQEFNGKVQELTEDNFKEAVNEALSGLEY